MIISRVKILTAVSAFWDATSCRKCIDISEELAFIFRVEGEVELENKQAVLVLDPEDGVTSRKTVFFILYILPNFLPDALKKVFGGRFSD
jgi:hypothetical protein